MKQPFPQLGRTVGIDAAMVRLSLSPHHHTAALRTMLRELELAIPPRMIFIFHHAHDFGDDIAAALDHYVVADQDAETVDLVLVVKRRAFDHRSANWNRSEGSQRGKFAGASNLHQNVVHLGHT